MKTARVILDKATYTYDKEYDYQLPDTLSVSAGCRVTVPFGAGNRTRIALVTELIDAEPPKKCKQIASTLDEQPLLNEEGLYLLRVLKSTTFCTWGDALHTLIPPGAGMKLSQGLIAVRGLDTESLSPDALRLYDHISTRKKTVRQEDALTACGLSADAPALKELIGGGFVMKTELIKKRIADERAVMARLTDEEPKKLTQKQKSVVEFLSQVGCATVKEIGYFTGVTRAVVDKLRDMGAVELYEEITVRTVPEIDEKPVDDKPICLSVTQQAAFDALCEQSDKNDSAVSLLYGVTGSGKTSVYLKLIERTLDKGRQVLVLIPEISLTPQTAKIFKQRFGSRVAVLHSSLSVSERLDEWNRIRTKKADIVVGTRSAVFAPLDNIGLIVIDEEQEHTYHSEKSPRFHARDIAKVRASYNKAHLLLCSATPSVESMYHAKNGAYRLVELGERYTDHGLPLVDTIDLRTEALAPASTILSQALCEQIADTLEKGEQAILLLNRRGYHTLVKCSSCGETARCPNCSIPLAYHTANGRLVCHYCGHSKPVTDPCERCGSKMMRTTGAGTQRAEEELKALYPDARVLRLDADTTMSRFSHRDKFEAFSKGEYDIMVGTQMIAKGLDFPNVTLVGVLSADQSLYTEDFRAFERTFALVTQVVGRSGRAKKAGRAVIQTYAPEHRVLMLASLQDYDSFYKEEIGYRRIGLYPPFCDMVCFVFQSENEKEAAESAKKFSKAFTDEAKKHPDMPLRLLGPAECSPYRVAGRYRCRLLVKCRNNRTFRAMVRDAIDAYLSDKGSIFPAIDCYYDSNV